MTTEVPLYLVPNVEGTGKRLVRRPHPPPTTAPLPDDFDAITETRDGTTVYDDAANSALDIDYDDLTVAPTPPAAYSRPSPLPIHAPLPISPPRNLATSSPPPQHHYQNQRQRRPGSPSHSLAGAGTGLSTDVVRGSPRRNDGLSPGTARSVAGGDRERERTSQRRSLGTGNVPPPPFPSSRGPAKGRNDLVEKLVIEDGPERTISVWRESVAKNANETSAGTAAVVTHGDVGGSGGGGGDGRSELDNHVGRRKVSAGSRRRVESLVQGPTGSPSVKSKGHRSRASADLTEVSHGAISSPFHDDAENPPCKPAQVSHSTLQPALSMRSSTPHANGPSQPTTPQKSQRRPSDGPNGTEYSASVSDASTKVASASRIESVLSSCQPSLLHLLPILEELGVRRWEHMTALARMREETRDREVKEEALKKGFTVVEWAILIDKLKCL
jgi:hypothetical protein